MTGIGPFDDRVALHLGKQPRSHALVAAREMGLAVLTGAATRGSASAIRHAVPFMLQHEGAQELNPTLFGPDQDWLTCQSDATVVTSRTAIVGAKDDATSLAELVSACNRFIRIAQGLRTVGVFAVHSGWLSTKRNRSVLISALSAIESPVGVMIGGSQRDPLDSARVVEGLVELIASLPEVLVLRCDHGALGAYAFGATAASIGIGTATRHFIGPDERGFADTDDQTPRLWVPSLHVWWKGSKLAAYDGNKLMDCQCRTCGGRSLARFQDEALRAEAEIHSVSSLQVMVNDIRSVRRERRADQWILMCRAAAVNLEELEDETGLPQPAGRQLKAWLRMAGVAVF
jgi:hypothetical protein